MANTEHYFTRFEPEKFYHVYNRTVDKKPMFRNDKNYEFFLRKFENYLSPVAETYAYCLLGNHFHLLIKILDLSSFKKRTDKIVNLDVHNVVSHQFRKFFQSYAMAFNKQEERVGTLFQTPFKRALVDSENYFRQMIYYIHFNPQSHGLIDNFKNWKWSSYQSIIGDNKTKLKKSEVISWFGDKKQFSNFHFEKQQLKNDNGLFIEDDIINRSII